MTLLFHHCHEGLLFLRHSNDNCTSWFFAVKIKDLVALTKVNESESIETKLSSVNETFIRCSADIADCDSFWFVEIVSNHDNIEVR